MSFTDQTRSLWGRRVHYRAFTPRPVATQPPIPNVPRAPSLTPACLMNSNLGGKLPSSLFLTPCGATPVPAALPRL